MDQRTLEALRASIGKWKKIEDDTEAEDRGFGNCPLCQLLINHILPDCFKCPVMENTGGLYCNLSPYREWASHQEDKHFSLGGDHRAKGCAECSRLATKERKFLESLLPKGER